MARRRGSDSGLKKEAGQILQLVIAGLQEEFIFPAAPASHRPALWCSKFPTVSTVGSSRLLLEPRLWGYDHGRRKNGVLVLSDMLSTLRCTRTQANLPMYLLSSHFNTESQAESL